MTQEHPTKLSFSIEESVWLNKGQEVKEILGMSLEPEISIEERGDHVYIKGGLRLFGEYRSVRQEEKLDLQNRTFEEQIPFRSITEISQLQDGLGEIKHFFPIDVTIPISRIQKLDDVYVQVESFDYDLPEKSCIQLTADVSISGMNHPQHEQQDEQRNEKREEVNKQDHELEDVPSAFSFEARKQQTQERPLPFMPQESLKTELPVKTERMENSTVNDVTEPPRTEKGFHQNDEEKSNQTEPAQKKVRIEEEIKAEAKERAGDHNHEKAEKKAVGDQEIDNEEGEIEAAQKNRSHDYVKMAAEESAMRQEETNIDVTEPSVPQGQPKTVEKNPILSQKTTVEKSEQRSELIKEEIADDEVILQEKDTKISLAPLKELASRPTNIQEEEDSETQFVAHKEENALYLTKMLTRGEERFSKWKMCIVQENESLDTIAHRYDVSATQLVRLNNLNEERIEEGQILYIPVSNQS